MDKLGTAAGDIDNFADQIAVDLLNKIFQVEIDIFDPRRQLSRIVVAQVFGVEVVEIAASVDECPARFGHLFAIDGDETVYCNFCRCAETTGIEHGWPKQSVEVNNVFADKVV